MANSHGYLPKAERDLLSTELQQRLEVWANKAYTDDNLFLTLAQSPGVLDIFLHWVTFVYVVLARSTALRCMRRRSATRPRERSAPRAFWMPSC